VANAEGAEDTEERREGARAIHGIAVAFSLS
jgi:hypothetical protein